MRGRIRSDDMVFMTYDYVNGTVYSSHQEKKKAYTHTCLHKQYMCLESVCKKVCEQCPVVDR